MPFFTFLAHLASPVDGASAELILHAVAHGFRHVVPEGLDHLAFLLGVCLVTRRVPELVGMVAGFTVAHSAAMAIAAQQWFRLPVAWVEVAVAVSIAWIAMEVLAGVRSPTWRGLTVVGFGGVHGLAFAHSFALVDLEGAPLWLGLAGFNFGIGLAQLGVVAAVLVLITPAWSKGWYRIRVAIPASCALAGLGVAWTVVRSLQL